MRALMRSRFTTLSVLLLAALLAVWLVPAGAGASVTRPQPSVQALAFRHPVVAVGRARAVIPAAIYTVRPGDTLSAISARFLGGAGNWPRLYGANVKVIGADPNMIIPGQQLALQLGPAQTGSVPSDPPPAQAATDPDGDSDGDGGNSGAPAQAPAQPAAVQQQQPSSSSGPWPGGSFGNCVVQRESGGSAQVMNSTGHYGLYQFSASTWAAYGGNPADFGNASVGEQEQVFMNAMAQGGQGNWSPYDGCLWDVLTCYMDIIPEKYGRWTVTGDSYMKDQFHRVVPCRCDCGTERDVLAFQLYGGKSQSCGCLKREQVGSLVSRTRWKNSHGLSKHPLYQLWKRINRRCYDQNADNYRWYGGCGVRVWEGWRHDAGAFIAYIEAELGPKPSPKHSIDRIDPYGHYEPGNLQWATPKGQAINRRSRARTG